MLLTHLTLGLSQGWGCAESQSCDPGPGVAEMGEQDTLGAVALEEEQTQEAEVTSQLCSCHPF